MPRMDRIPREMRGHLLALECPEFEAVPFVRGGPLSRRRVAIVSTAGLQRRGDRNFELLEAAYRVIPGDATAGNLLMSHVSVNFDRSGYQQDWNVAFPLDRLRELAAQGEIGSVADFHYSFMGATDPRAMEPEARALADLLRRDAVDAALLVPV